MNSIEFLEKQGFTCTRVKVDKEGVINPEDVRAAITDKTTLIAVHHVNHDIGTIAPIREIGKIAGERGIAFYVDAEASAGWLPIDVQAWGANLVVVFAASILRTERHRRSLPQSQSASREYHSRRRAGRRTSSRN